ncbi:MAG: hypothetical protein CMJ48_02655 [Planctomycetaceae bacterium]|nr:hypothetical protein [Planctomycetaceae bacterium]
MWTQVRTIRLRPSLTFRATIATLFYGHSTGTIAGKRNFTTYASGYCWGDCATLELVLRIRIFQSFRGMVAMEEAALAKPVARQFFALTTR